MSRKRMQGLLLSILLMGQVAAHAQVRAEFDARVDGRRIPGAEVCFSKGASTETPFDVWLSGGEAGCVGADDVIEMPLGVWHFWMQHSDGWITPYTATFVNRGMPGSPFKSLVQELSAAERFPVPDGIRLTAAERLYAYFATGWSPPVYPITGGMQAFLGPSASPGLLLKVRDRKPVDVLHFDGSPLTQDTQRRNVIVWVKVSDSLRQDPPVLSEMPPPRLVIVGEDGAAYEPFAPIERAKSSHFTVLIFPRIPSGRHWLRVSGEGWLPVELPVQVPEGSEQRVVVLEDGMELDRGASLRVAWTLPRELFSATACDAASHEAVRLEISRCNAEGSCTIAQATTLDHPSGDTVVNGLEAGTYRVRAGRGANAVEKRVEVELGRTSETALDYRGVLIHGTVSKDGKPLAAAVSADDQESTVTDPDGRYSLLIPPRGVVEIIARSCEDGTDYHEFLYEKIESDTRIDISFPSNRILVRVQDPVGQPVSAARVRAVSSLLDDPSVDLFTTDERTTDRAGVVEIRGLNEKYPYSVCADAEGFRQACTDAAPVQGDGTVTVTLQRFDGRSGRILASRPVHGGALFWVDRTGAVAHRGLVETDGAFTAPSDMKDLTHAVFVSQNLPLSVFPLHDASFRESLEMRVPDSSLPPTRITTPLFDESEVRYPVVFVRDMILPVGAFTYHQAMRGEQAAFSAESESLTLRDFAAAPLSAAVVKPATAAGDIETWLRQPGVIHSLRPRTLAAGATTELIP